MIIVFGWCWVKGITHLYYYTVRGVLPLQISPQVASADAWSNDIFEFAEVGACSWYLFDCGIKTSFYLLNSSEQTSTITERKKNHPIQ